MLIELWLCGVEIQNKTLENSTMVKIPSNKSCQRPMSKTVIKNCCDKILNVVDVVVKLLQENTGIAVYTYG